MRVDPRSFGLSLLSLIRGKQIKHTIVQEPFSLDKINQTGAMQFSDKAGILKLQRERVENYSCFD